jgi:hypothetical protein
VELPESRPPIRLGSRNTRLVLTIAFFTALVQAAGVWWTINGLYVAGPIMLLLGVAIVGAVVWYLRLPVDH